MASTRRAVIDVGTNSVKLLVADVAGCDVRPVTEAGNQTRLGQGFYETCRLQATAIRRTVTAVAAFAETARDHGATSVRVFATSAAREASNPDELCRAVEKACGLRLEIISGEQEAEWAFHGVRTNPKLARGPLMLLEVGGGSTQFILGQDGEIHLRESFPLGAVRVLETLPASDPPGPEGLDECRAWVRHFLHERVRPKLEAALRREVSLPTEHQAIQWVGVGGTATVLARMEREMTDYDRAKIEAVRLTRAKLRSWVERLWSLSHAERKRIPGLPPERADVILTGAAIYAGALEMFGGSALRISTRGLRFAAVMEAA
jgi:exopolyphosphatase / guanosine-5'-triphosphate,3'-diphosphate pyrophosphatase